MDEPGDVEAYSSAAAQAHLNRIDDTFVEQVLGLGVRTGLALDVGAGPGSILLKVAQRSPGLRLIGIDRSPAMIAFAFRSAAARGLADHANFCLADVSSLPFPNEEFGLVLSNSVLHHLRDPASAFSEMARVTKPGGSVLLRDLRRPSGLVLALHTAWYGRHYTGSMKELYANSVRAAYTQPELKELLAHSALEGGRIFLYRRTHLGLIWKKPEA